MDARAARSGASGRQVFFCLLLLATRVLGGSEQQEAAVLGTGHRGQAPVPCLCVLGTFLVPCGQERSVELAGGSEDLVDGGFWVPLEAK